MSAKKDLIIGKALKINGLVSSKDIISNKFTESYHDIIELVPFEDINPNFLEEVFSKNILVADKNFGYGSSKELPALSLKKSGVIAIIAKSFFTGFYKNAFNVGLLCIEANTDYIEDSDDLKINLKMAYIQNRTKQTGIKIKPVKKYFFKIYQSGGLLNSLFEERIING